MGNKKKKLRVKKKLKGGAETSVTPVARKHLGETQRHTPHQLPLRRVNRNQIDSFLFFTGTDDPNKLSNIVERDLASLQDYPLIRAICYHYLNDPNIVFDLLTSVGDKELRKSLGKGRADSFREVLNKEFSSREEVLRVLKGFELDSRINGQISKLFRPYSVLTINQVFKKIVKVTKVIDHLLSMGLCSTINDAIDYYYTDRHQFMPGRFREVVKPRCTCLDSSNIFYTCRIKVKAAYNYKVGFIYKFRYADKLFHFTIPKQEKGKEIEGGLYVEFKATFHVPDNRHLPLFWTRTELNALSPRQLQKRAQDLDVDTTEDKDTLIKRILEKMRQATRNQGRDGPSARDNYLFPHVYCSLHDQLPPQLEELELQSRKGNITYTTLEEHDDVYFETQKSLNCGTHTMNHIVGTTLLDIDNMDRLISPAYSAYADADVDNEQLMIDIAGVEPGSGNYQIQSMVNVMKHLGYVCSTITEYGNVASSEVPTISDLNPGDIFKWNGYFLPEGIERFRELGEGGGQIDQRAIKARNKLEQLRKIEIPWDHCQKELELYRMEKGLPSNSQEINELKLSYTVYEEHWKKREEVNALKVELIDNGYIPPDVYGVILSEDEGDGKGIRVVEMFIPEESGAEWKYSAQIKYSICKRIIKWFVQRLIDFVKVKDRKKRDKVVYQILVDPTKFRKYFPDKEIEFEIRYSSGDVVMVKNPWIERLSRKELDTFSSPYPPGYNYQLVVDYCNKIGLNSHYIVDVLQEGVPEGLDMIHNKVLPPIFFQSTVDINVGDVVTVTAYEIFHGMLLMCIKYNSVVNEHSQNIKQTFETMSMKKESQRKFQFEFKITDTGTKTVLTAEYVGETSEGGDIVSGHKDAPNASVANITHVRIGDRCIEIGKLEKKANIYDPYRNENYRKKIQKLLETGKLLGLILNKGRGHYIAIRYCRSHNQWMLMNSMDTYFYCGNLTDLLEFVTIQTYYNPSGKNVLYTKDSKGVYISSLKHNLCENCNGKKNFMFPLSSQKEIPGLFDSINLGAGKEISVLLHRLEDEVAGDDKRTTCHVCDGNGFIPTKSTKIEYIQAIVAPDVKPFEKDTAIVVEGLINQEGVIIRYDKESGRYEVRLESGETIDIRSSNLRKKSTLEGEIMILTTDIMGKIEEYQYRLALSVPRHAGTTVHVSQESVPASAKSAVKAAADW